MATALTPSKIQLWGMSHSCVFIQCKEILTGSKVLPKHSDALTKVLRSLGHVEVAIGTEGEGQVVVAAGDQFVCHGISQGLPSAPG